MPILEERLQQVKYYIPDDNLRHIIFNYDDEDPLFLSDEKVCLQYFSNAMTFSMLTVWNIFLSWKKNVEEQNNNGNNSFWRIYNMLDKTCDPVKINGEYIDDLLLNLEIDCLLDTEETQSFVETIGISNFFHFNSRNNKLSKYIYMVKQSRLHSRNVGVSFGFDAFCQCLEVFHFLRTTKIRFYPSEICLNHSPQNNMMGIIAEFGNSSDRIKKIDYSHTMFTTPFEIYYVEDFQPFDARHFDEKQEKHQSVVLNYVQLGGTGRISVTLMNEEFEDVSDKYVIVKKAVIENFFLDCDIINLYRNNNESTFFRDYILLNNRYLKNISYTLSDALTSDMRTEIVRQYGKKYQDIFEKMYVSSLYNNNEIVGYRWDEIVLFLLLEEGVYEFLRFLLHGHSCSYKSIKNAFIRRFGKETIENVCKGDEFLTNPEYKLVPGASENAKIDCHAKALVVLATKLLSHTEWDIESSVYPTTIDSIITECERVHGLSNLVKEKIIFYSNTLLQTLSFVTRFYRGVFRYSQCKMDAIIDLNSTGAYQEFQESKEQCIEELKATLAKSAEQYSKEIICSRSETVNSIKERICKSFNELINLNDEYSSFHDENNEVLFETTGKRYLFDSKKMKLFCKKICKVMADFGFGDENALFKEIKSFFMYLKTGLDEKERMELKESEFNVESAIFPIVGQYSSGTTSVDGYKYSVFKVLSPANNDPLSSIRIKMITEDEFDFGRSYYCVPNVNRIANVFENPSFDKIWVSPIIIPCSVYLHQSISHLEQLSDESDFDEAAELVYGSDVVVYKKLFGSLNNAKKVMPYLFSNQSSKFSKKHYYVLKKSNKIVAIASLYEYDEFSWNSDIIKKAFADAQVEPPSTFEEAVNEIKETFYDYPGKMYCYIDDVCVRESERRRGIGCSMIMYLIKAVEAQGKSVRLSVYSENTIARHLYSNMGFVPLSRTVSGNNGQLTYIQMIRI